MMWCFSEYSPTKPIVSAQLLLAFWRWKVVTFSLSLTALAVILSAATSHAQQFPNGVVKITVSTPPGSSVDLVARLFGQYLTESWKQSVVVENRGGANGQIAVSAVVGAAPDGHNLLATTAATLSTNPFLYPKTGLSILNLVPVTMLVGNDLLLSVRPELNIKTFPEFLAWVRANPGKLNMATNGRGGAFNLAAEMLKQVSDLDFTIVPYAGGGGAVTSVLSGTTDAIIETTTLTKSLVDDGKLISIATTGSKRSVYAPNVPAIMEAGITNYAVSGWIAIVAPKGTPPAIVDKIYAALKEAGKNDALQKRLQSMQLGAILNTPAEFDRQWKADLSMWKDVIAKSGIDLDK